MSVEDQKANPETTDPWAKPMEEWDVDDFNRAIDVECGQPADPEFDAAMRKSIVAAETANRLHALEALLRRWLEFDASGIDDDAAEKLVRDTREALHV